MMRRIKCVLDPLDGTFVQLDTDADSYAEEFIPRMTIRSACPSIIVVPEVIKHAYYRVRTIHLFDQEIEILAPQEMTPAELRRALVEKWLR